MEKRSEQLHKFDNALVDLMVNLDYLVELWEACDDNLNDLHANKLFPFNKSLDELQLEVREWVVGMHEEIVALEARRQKEEFLSGVKQAFSTMVINDPKRWNALQWRIDFGGLTVALDNTADAFALIMTAVEEDLK